MTHAVRLPYPDRQEPTVGTCNGCEWATTYGWGEHGDALDRAAEHVRDAEHAEPVEAAEMSGVRFVLPGHSL